MLRKVTLETEGHFATSDLALRVYVDRWSMLDSDVFSMSWVTFDFNFSFKRTTALCWCDLACDSPVSEGGASLSEAGSATATLTSEEVAGGHVMGEELLKAMMGGLNASVSATRHTGVPSVLTGGKDTCPFLSGRRKQINGTKTTIRNLSFYLYQAEYIFLRYSRGLNTIYFWIGILNLVQSLPGVSEWPDPCRT